MWEVAVLGGGSSRVFPTDLVETPLDSSQQQSTPAPFYLYSALILWQPNGWPDLVLWYMTHLQAPVSLSSWNSILVGSPPRINFRPSSSLWSVTHSVLDPFSLTVQNSAVQQNFLWWRTCSVPSLSNMVNTSACGYWALEMWLVRLRKWTFFFFYELLKF